MKHPVWRIVAVILLVALLLLPGVPVFAKTKTTKKKKTTTAAKTASAFVIDLLDDIDNVPFRLEKQSVCVTRGKDQYTLTYGDKQFSFSPTDEGVDEMRYLVCTQLADFAFVFNEKRINFIYVTDHYNDAHSGVYRPDRTKPTTTSGTTSDKQKTTAPAESTVADDPSAGEPGVTTTSAPAPTPASRRFRLPKGVILAGIIVCALAAIAVLVHALMPRGKH